MKLTDEQCDEFRRLPLSFNDMVRAIYQAGVDAGRGECAKANAVAEVAINTLEQIATTPRNRGAQRSASATLAFLRTQTKDGGMNWTPFFFDSNSAWGVADCPEAWRTIRSNWMRYGTAQQQLRPQDEIYEATLAASSLRQHTDDLPSFGFRAEHLGGKQTLREFFSMHGMPCDID